MEKSESSHKSDHILGMCNKIQNPLFVKERAGLKMGTFLGSDKETIGPITSRWIGSGTDVAKVGLKRKEPSREPFSERNPNKKCAGIFYGLGSSIKGGVGSHKLRELRDVTRKQ